VTAGYCEPVTALYESEGLNTAIPQALIDQVTQDNEKYAVPVGVHRGNSFWYNRQVLADAGVEAGESMTVDQFFTAADALKAKGIPALALGDKDAFVSPQTLENTLLAVLGPEGYNGLWDGTTAWDSAEVREAIDTFDRMLGYINEDHAALTWDGAVGMVIDGKAGFNSMGDWAYGEVVAKNAQDTIGWVSHPGTEAGFVLVVDCFTLPKGAPNAENASSWLKVCGSVAGQEAFNPLKGSIPARTDVDPAKFNEYQKWAIANFAEASLVPSVAHGSAASPAFKQAMYDAVNAYVTDRDADTLVTTLMDAQSAEA
jgi:glucose/mannose transport system substrate-binding protein